MEKEENLKKILNKLLNKEITPSEAMEKLNIMKNDDLLMMIDSCNILTSQRTTDLSLANVKKMNIVDINKFEKIVAERGLTKELLISEIEFQWESGLLNGFDYRYFVESLDCPLRKTFVNRARNMGRYTK